MADSPSLWELRRRSLVRAHKRRREGEAEGLHDFRVALRRTAATAGALGRRKVERRALEIVRSLSSDRQSEVDRVLLTRVRGLGLLSQDAATALEIRWKPVAPTRADRSANGKDEKRFRRLTRKLRRLGARPRAGELPRLLAERGAAEAALTKPPAKDDDRSLHRYRIRVKRARYLAEDLVASGRPEFEASVARERAAQDVLGRWNDLRLFLEQIDRERTKAERRGAVRLAAELEDLGKALETPLVGLRREAAATARGLSASITSAARHGRPEPEERKTRRDKEPRRVRNPTISAS